MLKLISAVMAAAAIAGVLTLLSATSARLDAGPLAKPEEAALKACTERPWPYFNNCIGTPHGNPRIRLLTTEQLTPSAGMLGGSVSDARSILLKGSQIQDW
jgi:hypothetical protein